MTTIQKIEKMIGRNQSIMVDTAIQLVAIVPWQRAMTLLMGNEGYTLIPRKDRNINSMDLSIPMPLIFGLNRYVPKREILIDNDEFVSKKMILNRDKWTCQYCGEFGNTVDHIFPKSLGGGNTWGNLCAACQKCNNAKRNRTPKEAGMKEPFIPKRYENHKFKVIQESIYKALEEAAQ